MHRKTVYFTTTIPWIIQRQFEIGWFSVVICMWNYTAHTYTQIYYKIRGKKVKAIQNVLCSKWVVQYSQKVGSQLVVLPDSVEIMVGSQVNNVHFSQIQKLIKEKEVNHGNFTSVNFCRIWTMRRPYFCQIHPFLRLHHWLTQTFHQSSHNDFIS